MSIRLIISICLFAGILIGRLIYDLHLYFSGKPNRHLIAPLITAGALVGCVLLAGLSSAPMFIFGFWSIFDSLYGIFIGQGPLYVGTTAKLDKLQHSYPILKWIKYLGAIAGVIVFCIWKAFDFFTL